MMTAESMLSKHQVLRFTGHLFFLLNINKSLMYILHNVLITLWLFNGMLLTKILWTFYSVNNIAQRLFTSLSLKETADSARF